MLEDLNATVILLKQLHNDILALHLAKIVEEMHRIGHINDEEYAKILVSEYKIVDNQIQAMNKDISHSKQAT